LATAPSFNNPLDKFSYNRSEYNAFICADTFKDFVADVRTKTGYQAVNVMAHSQGNIMVSEAIKLGANVTNYVLREAAVPASCYDGSTLTMPNDPRLDENSTDRDKKLRQAPNKYPGYFEGITAGNIVNFFNKDDSALQTGHTLILFETNWIVNQIRFKPDGPFATYNRNKKITATYEYTQNAQQQWQSNLKERQWVRDAFDRWEGPTITWTRSFPVAPSYEELAFVARSRTRAIGAILPENAASIRGSIKGNVNLQNDILPRDFRFTDKGSDHSGQFSRPIQKCFWFYQNVLQAFGIDPIDQPGAPFTNLNPPQP
jgi:pimeloyl-ACP methyl ester carboxylesterase